MVQRRFVLYAVAFAMAFLVMGTTAWADIVVSTGAVTGTVWKVGGNMGDAPTSTSFFPPLVVIAAEGTFTSANVNFYTKAGTLGDFLSTGSDGNTNGLISDAGVAGTLSQMSSCTDSIVHTTDGKCYQTIVEIQGSYTFVPGVTYTVTHDDGAIMYIGGNFSPLANVLGAGSEKPTVSVGSSFTVSGSTSGAFEIFFMGTNGDPEELQLTQNVPNPVPDGGVTLMFLGGALVGLETLRRKFRV